jgi:chemotaxis response regulator CheB
MLDSPVRVALLARPGDARDQLRRALAELGARLVAEGDPAELDPAQVAGEKPTVVLVSLEPAIEDSLSRFDDLLAAPGVDVMYDDAETTRQLDGWDLARWARHLAAKLVGTDLLPPAPGGSDHLPEINLTLEPGAPRTPAQEMADEKLEDYAAESLDLSEWVPTEPSLTDAGPTASDAAAAQPAVVDATPAEDELSLDLDLGGLELAMEAGRAEEAPPSIEATGGQHDDLEFNAADFDIDLSAFPEEGSPLPSASEPEPTLIDEAPLLVDLELEGGTVNFSSFTDEEAPMSAQMDDDVAALAAHLDAYEAQDRQPEPAAIDFTSNAAREPEPEPTPAAPEPAAVPAPRPSSAFGSLELMPMDGEQPAAPAAAPVAPPVLGEAPVPASSSRLSLVDDNDGAVIDNRPAAPGALLVIAGLGGPDAVRQLLSALPPNLPVPVLLYQHLDTGKHDRLLGQLAKASKLPLDLAIEGKIAFAGRVGVLQPGVGVRHDGRGFAYVAVNALADVPAALPAADSVVLLLSGADPSVVPAVLALHGAGALVLAQDPASCFDSVSAGLLIDAGAVAASPAELARIVIERWK